MVTICRTQFLTVRNPNALFFEAVAKNHQTKYTGNPVILTDLFAVFKIVTRSKANRVPHELQTACKIMCTK